MSNRQQLEKFHQHLVAIELAGFRIGSQLLQKHEEPTDIGHSEASILQLRLRQLATQLGDRSGDDFMHLLSAQPIVTPDYISSFQQWLESNEQIASLEHLLTEDDLQVAASQAHSRTWLHLAIFSVLGVLALATVWGLSLKGIQELVGQLRIDPPWALKSLMMIQPYFWWIIAAVVVGILFFGWILTRRASLGVSRNDAEQALNRARLAGLLSAQLSSSTPSHQHETLSQKKSTSDSPLLEWACHVAPQQGLDARKVLGLAKQLYLWISLDRNQRSSISGPQLSGAAIGGVIALSAGLLLFYPLVQLLKVVIDTSGLAR